MAKGNHHAIIKEEEDLGCLSRKVENALHNFKVQNDTLKTLFQADTLSLCYICKRMAQHAELFIQNVQSNQILLANFHNLMDCTFQNIRDQIEPVIELKHFPLDMIQLSGNPSDDVDEPYSVMYSGSVAKAMNIKQEIKEENGDMSDHLEGEFVDNDEFHETLIKGEDEFQIKALLKEEVESDDVDLKYLKETLKKKKVKKRIKKSTEVDKKDTKKAVEIPKTKHVFITMEQCMEERAKMMQDTRYLNCLYKCEKCIKGFNYKPSYEEHMQKHSEKMGDYVCDICTQRRPTEEKLQSHRQYHQRRYKCIECDLVRVSKITIKEHYTATHCFGYFQYNCPHCPKVFTRQVSLRKHICYCHTRKSRVSCPYCPKTYANKESLKVHIMGCHEKDESAGVKNKPHVCLECGMRFSTPSSLKNHSIKHVRTRDFYCVECDKSFKSDAVLKHHLKTALPHISYLELPLACLHCDKRFAIKRDLERHMNRIHLNIRPHKCDKCDKAYVNNWSLREHKKIVHDGYQRPRKYPCTMCDKVFDRQQILKSHIRTHTGERPYHCTKCSAQFSQANVLATHNRLIHLKLTRNGKPKPGIVKSE
ncbi:unnamed protein product [Chilo suppressalis]|uniref:C2H2-type domain-containing protein n=1 Tax=Chilo suppressalis TaxID=168631 RepID=A0ABN8B4V7_CHISP|nr:unnamed protein product [Chilo suppressalis]